MILVRHGQWSKHIAQKSRESMSMNTHVHRLVLGSSDLRDCYDIVSSCLPFTLTGDALERTSVELQVVGYVITFVITNLHNTPLIPQLIQHAEDMLRLMCERSN